MDEIKQCKCGGSHVLRKFDEVLAYSLDEDAKGVVYTIRCPFCGRGARGIGETVQIAGYRADEAWNKMMEEEADG